jgi:HEAT repeat protein
MGGNCGRRTATLVCCLLAVEAAGCTGGGGLWGRAPTPQTAGDDLPDVPSPAERMAALRQLAREAGSQSAREKQRIAQGLSESICREEDPLIRAEIVRTLGAYPGEASGSVLRAALDDPDVEVRTAACEVWGRRGDAEAVTLLSGVLDGDLDMDVRLAAARALGQSNNPAAAPALGRALEDKDPAIQYRAVLSLRKVTGKDFGNDVNKWRQYMAGELPDSGGSASLAQRLWKVLRF